MKLIFRGKFKSYDDLPQNELPENAVMFKEPKSMAMVNVVACVIAVFLALILFAILDLRNRRNCMYLEAGWGLLVSALLMIPHELIHAVCMGGCGDMMNVINAAIQMPRGSVTQAAGLNSYWFMPEDKAESDT